VKKSSAFTLLEVMIVLAIMVSLLAMSWPRMRKAASRAALREAALQVKAGLAEARDLAVRNCAETRFSFQNNCSEFRIAEADSAFEDQEDVINLDVPGNDLALNHHSGEEFDQLDSTSHELPNQVTFAALKESETGSSTMARNGVPVASHLSRLSPFSSDDDSTVEDTAEHSINFFPDGRCSSATIRLGSADTHETVTLTVRALTGGVTIGQIEHIAEDEQLAQDERVIEDAEDF
jgi:prepilin-type N-terminal cleavage/methylation domain-containing protein